MPRKFSLSSLWGQGRPSKPARRHARPRKGLAARRSQPFRFAPLGLEMLEDLDLLSGTGEQLVRSETVAGDSQGNGGFETGDFSNWGVSESQAGLANVATSYQETSQLYAPIEGEFFALLRTGDQDQFTSISQDFVVDAGETVSGWAFFDTTESSTFFNDEAEIRVLQNGQVVATVFAASVVSVGGNDGATPWTYWQHTFDAGGTYTLEAHVTNRQDSVVDSFLGIDAVSFRGVGVSNVAPTFISLATGPDFPVQFENTGVTILFADPNHFDVHRVFVDWGNGTTDSSVLPVGQRNIEFFLPYGEPGLYEIVVTVSDNFGGSDTRSVFVEVAPANVAPTIDSVTTDPTSIDQFESVLYVLNFTDPDAGDVHQIDVDWGDGTPVEVFDVPAGERAGSAFHTYQTFGSFSVTVNVSDDRGGSATEVFDVTVNPAAPQILEASLAPQSDTGVLGDNSTNLALPSLLIRAFDPSPSATGALTFRIDVDNDGVFDRETTLLADGSSPVAATIALAQPLAEGTHTIGVEIRDADGHADFATFQIVVDRTPPAVVASSVTSLDGALQFVVELSENLNPAAAANLANYLLLASGGDGGFLEGNEIDRTGTAQVTYFDAGAGLPPRIVVFAPLADETYRLTIDVDALADRAGNVRTAGDLTLRAVHDTVGPQVERVVAFNALGGQSNAILIDFAQPLDPATVVPGSFALELLGPGGTTVLPLTVQYTQFGNRVIARVPGATAGPFAELAAGSYRLTISGLRSAVGTPQNEASVHAFDVAAQSGTTLNAEVLAGNAQSLNAFTAQLLEQAETAHAALSDDAFLQSLLATARETFIALAGGAQEQVAEAVSQTILQLFNDRAAAQGNQNEYIVVWGRFVGIELPDAIVLSLPDHPEWSMAVLRVQAAAGNPLVTSSQAVQIVTAGVTGAMQEIVATLTGQQAVNSGGVIYINPTGSNTEAFVNVAATGEQRTLSAENISGFALVEAIDAHIHADFAALLGVTDLTQVPGSFLILWFDPVDFVLTDAQGQQIGHAGGTTLNQVPNAFYSGDGTTELLVIPNATGGDYNLSLVGAGSEFRGTATFVSNGQVVSVPLQGTLAAGSNVVAVLDFRGLGEPLPSGPEFTGLERSTAGLEALAAAFSNAALAGIVSFAPGQEEVRARDADEALPPTAESEPSAFVLQQADGVLLTAFAVPGEAGAYRLRVVELQTDDRGITGPRPIELRVEVRDDASYIEIVFDRDLTPEQVAAADRVVLVWAGPDGQFDTPDDEAFALGADDVDYDAATKTLRISGHKLPPGKYLLKLDLSAVEKAAGDAAAPANGQPNAGAAAPAEGAAEADETAAMNRLWQSWPSAANSEELLAKLRPADAADQNAWFENYRDGAGDAPADEAPDRANSPWAFAAGAAVATAFVARPKARSRRRR